MSKLTEGFLAAALATGAATGMPETYAQQPVPLTKPMEAAGAPKEKIAQLDVSEFALTEKSPVTLGTEGADKDKMLFTLQKLPADKLVKVKIAREQIYQTGNIVDKDGNLLALLIPSKNDKKDGTVVRVLEIPKGTELDLVVTHGDKELFTTSSLNLVKLKGGAPYGWLKGYADKLEAMPEGTKLIGEKQANAINFLKGNMLDEAIAAIASKRLVVDKDSPLATKGNKATWDGVAQTAIEADIKKEMKK